MHCNVQMLIPTSCWFKPQLFVHKLLSYNKWHVIQSRDHQSKINPFIHARIHWYHNSTYNRSMEHYTVLLTVKARTAHNSEQADKNANQPLTGPNAKDVYWRLNRTRQHTKDICADFQWNDYNNSKKVITDLS